MNASVAPSVSVVVIGLGAETRLDRAVEVVRARSRGHDLEVVAVRRGSGDGSEVVGADVTANIDRRSGAGAAWNVGAARATGEILVLLDDDTRVLGGWLPPLLGGLDHPDVVATGSLLVAADGSAHHAGLALDDAGDVTEMDAGRDVVELDLVLRRRVLALSAVGLAVRRERFHAAGGFDPSFTDRRARDLDLALAARSVDGVFGLEPASQVIWYRDRCHGPVPDDDRHRLTARWGRDPRAQEQHGTHDVSVRAVVLVRSDESPATRRGLEDLARLAAAKGARVTVLMPSRTFGSEFPSPGVAGVELIVGEPDVILTTRRAEFDVVTASHLDGALEHLIARTQPQAQFIEAGSAPDGSTAELIIESGVRRRTSGVHAWPFPGEPD